MSTVFSKIIKGEIPCFKVFQNDRVLAFLDVNPLARGHVLVIPKVEVDNLFDLEEGIYNELFLVTKKLSACIKEVVPCKKIGLAVIGLEVPHAHIHLVPINNADDLNFTRKKLTFSDQENIELAAQISQAFKLIY